MRKTDNMNPLSDQDFRDFLNDYHEHYLTSAEISKPVYEDENGRKWRGRKLVNSNFRMYSLDDIKDECKVWNEYNKPKSTDGIFYKNKKNGLEIYLVEFKGHNLSDEDHKNNLKVLKEKFQNEINEYKNSKPEKECYKQKMVDELEKAAKNYMDSVQHSLEQKPIETLFITIPTLYKDYCERTGETEKDIIKFIRTHKKRLFVFAYDEIKEEKDNSEPGKEEEDEEDYLVTEEDAKRKKDDDKTEKSIYPLRSKLNNYYFKLKKGQIISSWEIYKFDQFDDFLDMEKLRRPRRYADINIHTLENV